MHGSLSQSSYFRPRVCSKRERERERERGGGGGGGGEGGRDRMIGETGDMIELYNTFVIE